ncbi:MAG TPA: response regulator [Noviherbaspirillum sp.]|nr:response regulator [Noviherbaspirillum sp.]
MNGHPILPVIYLLDDDAAVRQSLALLLSTVGMSVKAYAEPDVFLREFEPGLPGAILLDVRMPGIGGMTVLDRLAAMRVTQPIIVLTGHGTIDLCRRAFKAGAAEFLEKPVDDELLIDTLQECLKTYLLQSSRMVAERQARERFERLSAREREVLDMIIAGLTNREIARALDLSPRTVEFHRARVAEKLETGTLAELIRHYAPLVESAHI